MLTGVPAEAVAGETRVAVTPTRPSMTALLTTDAKRMSRTVPSPLATRQAQVRAGLPVLRRRALAGALAAVGLLSSAALAANPMEAMELPAVNVVARTPLPGLGAPLRDVPANVQVYGGVDIDRARQSGLAEFLEQSPSGITINSSQGNPFQPDVNFRGFTASPVLGTPQGLSVFLDGVRVNEPFGDVVNWDLIPQSAISSLQLIPGSNPAFGLNTLGGALAVHTKSGSHYPGGALQTYAGSYGRKGAEFEYGGKNGNLDYFVTANAVDDQGWAAHNPSQVRQLFGKLGWQDAQTDIDLSVIHADNTLQGTQTLPLSFYRQDIRQAYTWPDSTRNELSMLGLKGSRYLSDRLILGGNAYYRNYRSGNVSSNVNAFDAADPTAPQATNARSAIDQDSYGLGLQLTWLGELAGRENQFTLGASADFGRARFTQDEQAAALTAERSAVGIGDFERETDALTRNAYYGLFFTDTLSLAPQWTLTASGRYNQARVRIEDQSGQAPELNGDHRFARFNPAVGINFNPTERLTAYASYNEGSRAPTPIELACADPAAPCKLPNNFVSDPALKLVVARTVEAGLRGKLSGSQSWSLAAYRTQLQDDIQFISAGGVASNAGYFQNVGDTRRQGLEAALGKRWGRFAASARFSYVDATYQSPFVVNAPANSSADAAGNIQVRPRHRIPGIPAHSIKLRFQYDFGEQASLGANIHYSGAVFARGDESNQDANGRVPGYTVVNLDGRYQLSRGVELFGRVANLFDRRYANFGVLAHNWFTGPGNSYDGSNPVSEQFRGPGAPRGIWVGMRARWQ